MNDEQIVLDSAPLPSEPTPEKKNIAAAVIGIIVILAIAAGVFYLITHPQQPDMHTPGVTNLQIGTYSTSTKQIVKEKNVFDTKETIGVRGVVNNLPASSTMMVLLTSNGKNYYSNFLPNSKPITSDPFHFTYGEERPAGTYTLLLELFGPDRQQIGEKIEKQFTVK